MFDLGSGSDKLTDTTNQWVAGEYHGTTSSVKLTHTNSATLQFAGVQLEAGTQATAFEHRSFAEELSLCQRYWSSFRWEYIPRIIHVCNWKWNWNCHRFLSSTC